MRKRIEWKVETLLETQDVEHTRIKVVGGWLVIILIVQPKGSSALTTTFVEDRNHEWEILQPKPAALPPAESLAKDFEAKS
jgi:hypothetical protein